MTSIVEWAASHSRMILACMVLSVVSGFAAYFGLPKEGAPDIEVPSYHVSVAFPGISAEDSERLLVKPLEARLKDIDGLDEIFGTASEGYAGIALSFEFGLDRAKTVADIRENVDRAQVEFPDGAKPAVISEFSFSELPIIVVVVSGDVPERTLFRVSEDIREKLEALPPILEVGFVGHRPEMVEVTIDPLQLEAYNVSADELIQVVTRNNRLVAAGEVESSQGAFSLKIPSSFDQPQDIYDLPIKVDGNRVVTLGDLSEIRLTFDDRTGYARHNGEPTIALQVSKRKGTNVIETASLIRRTVEAAQEDWPASLRDAISVEFSQDISSSVQQMVTQLENSVLTAVALVMVVVLAALGTRSALLVGFAIPTSFLLCFSLLAVVDIAISNIVMFGLILAVGMLVDSAIVIVELADRRIKEGAGPMAAYTEAAKRMFWPIVSSTATTLCAFLPMLFWPGIAGQFMGTLPVTIIFVLSASLLVALIFLPVVGGVSGRVSRLLERASNSLRSRWLILRLLALALVTASLVLAVLLVINPGLLPRASFAGPVASLPGLLLFLVSSVCLSVVVGSLRFGKKGGRVAAGRRRTMFGHFIKFVVGNPIMPLVVLVAIVAFVTTTFRYYGENNHGVSFFVDTEPDQIRVYVRARGNLSLSEKDQLVSTLEDLIVGTPGVASVFAFSGDGGLNQIEGQSKPLDTIGEIQIEFDSWEDRQEKGGFVEDSRNIMASIEARIRGLPGIRTEVQVQSNGPEQGKPLNLRISGENWSDLLEASMIVRNKFDELPGLTFVDDTRPLPGIDWKIDVNVEEAGRYGTDVATIGGMVQLLTRGLLAGTMRVDSSDEEIDIRVRLPEEDRHLSTLDTLRVRSPNGLVPLSNFVTRKPVDKIGVISRFDQVRYIDVRAGVEEGLVNDVGRPMTPTERISFISDWLESEAGLPDSIDWSWVGDQEEQEESQTFLMRAFIGALGLMFAVLLAQFNSFYNAMLVLLAVVLSTAGVTIGLLILQQPFSIIMSGVGVVALAGIVVNNNIVLIDTYQEYSRYMPRIEAIIRSAEVRIRPVLLTSITTIAGLMPMMFGFSIDIVQGGYTIDAPSIV